MFSSASPDLQGVTSLLDILQKGGFVIWILGILSIVTTCLVILYFFTIRRSAAVTNRFVDMAETLVREGDLMGLITYCHRRNESVARVTLKTVDFLTSNRAATATDLREVAEAEASRQASYFRQRVSYLADLAAISPMVGLLGTVIGMIKSFMQISEGNFEGVKQLQMAQGVWEALITTAGGLAVGIFAIVFYSFYRGRVTRIVAELESASAHLLALLGSYQTKRTSGGNPTPLETSREIQ